MTGGGHSALASTYGMGADQVLSLNVVTADGRYLTADPLQNTDLFYALRGGGGSTYAVVVSAIVKAHPFTRILASSVAFSVRNSGDNATDAVNTAAFWKGFDLYHDFGRTIVDNSGTACYVSRMSGNNGFTFTTDIELPNVSEEVLADFVQPLLDNLRAAGLNVTNRGPSPASNWASLSSGTGDTPGSSRFASRLLPRANFDDPELFTATQLAIRQSIESGYTFHGIHIKPTEEVAGYPGNNAVNPAFRTTIMHADLFDNTRLRGLSPTAFKETHAALAKSMDAWREVSPGAGAYMNECDLLEPNWQQAFFGTNYDKLLQIKRARDPWGVFYAPATVGSEAWVVLTEDDMPTQNGPLCRAGSETVRRWKREVE